MKARTAACAAPDAVFSIASFNDLCTIDCTWVSCGDFVTRPAATQANLVATPDLASCSWA